MNKSNVQNELLSLKEKVSIEQVRSVEKLSIRALNVCKKNDINYLHEAINYYKENNTQTKSEPPTGLFYANFSGHFITEKYKNEYKNNFYVNRPKFRTLDLGLSRNYYMNRFIVL